MTAERKATWPLKVLWAVVWLTVGALVVIAVFAWTRTDPYDPIMWENPQQVVNESGLVPRVPGVDGPAVRGDGTVPVRARWCIDSDEETLELVGNLWWQRVDQPGFRVQIDDAVAYPVAQPAGWVQHPGPDCEVLTFRNEVPPEVRQIVESSGQVTQWRITGDTTPTRPGSVTATWETEPFAIVPVGLSGFGGNDRAEL